MPRPPLKMRGKQEPFGLGDAFALVAQPIARVIDFWFGTNIKNCAGCRARRVVFNHIVPDVRRPFKR